MKTEAYTLLDSVIPTEFGPKRVTTFKVIFPRIILPEVNTHRVFSRNYQSSRAVPNKRLLSDWCVYVPDRFMKNQPGMQSFEYLPEDVQEEARIIWKNHLEQSKTASKKLSDLGVHKQQCNRLLEPFLYIPGLITSSKWDNFWELRCDEGADPVFRELADAMQAAYLKSSPEERNFHIPFIDGESHLLEDLLRISVARCARVSYKLFDGKTSSYEKDIDLFDKLISAKPLHASPSEHQVMSVDGLKELISYRHLFYKSNELNGNLFKGLVQYRKLLELKSKEI